MPTFSDWRVAYIGQDGALHVISQDGASDSRASVAGGALPLMEQTSYDVLSAGISPDGQYFAYGSDQRYIINLAARSAPTLPLVTVADAPSALCWSPDSKRLAIASSQGWSIVAVATDQATLVPGSVAAQAQLPGWINGAHLLGLTGNTGDSTRVLLSLDISSGVQHTIATISTGNLSNPIFVLSPDGKQVLLYNVAGGEGNTIPYRAFVAVIDTATGQQQPLPKIAQLTNGGFITVAWKPGKERSQDAERICTTLHWARSNICSHFSYPKVPLALVESPRLCYSGPARRTGEGKPLPVIAPHPEQCPSVVGLVGYACTAIQPDYTASEPA